MKKSQQLTHRIVLVGLAVVLSVGSSACLKTRAQLRGENSDDDSRVGSTPQPAKIQDVQPQAGAALDELKIEINRQNARIEDLERGKRDAGAEDTNRSAEIKKLEARMVELEQTQSQVLETFKKMQEAQIASTKDPLEAFDAAMKFYGEGSYDQAIDNFSVYLKSPKAKKHVEESTFLRAESYFSLKQYKKAIVDYSKFPEKFTSSKRMPAALLRIGQSFDALGMRDDAKSFYQELTDKFPKSKEAKTVRSKQLR